MVPRQSRSSQSLHQQTRKINSNFFPHQLLNHDSLCRSAASRVEMSLESPSRPRSVLFPSHSPDRPTLYFSKLIQLRGGSGGRTRWHGFSRRCSIFPDSYLGLGHFGNVHLAGRPASPVRSKPCQREGSLCDVHRPQDCRSFRILFLPSTK